MMDSTKEGKWAYASTEEGPFYGEFSSAEEAVLERFGYHHNDEPLGDAFLDERCYVGQMRAPVRASDYMPDADFIIENIACQDGDYWGDWASNWPNASKDQLGELTDMLRAAFDTWEDKHGLRPKFFVVDGAESMSVREAIARLESASP